MKVELYFYFLEGLRRMNISTLYLGMKLSSPIIPSASPLSRTIGNIKAMEDYGAGAIVLHSILEEHLRYETQELFYFLTYSGKPQKTLFSFFFSKEEESITPDNYLEYIHQAKKSVHIPIIASINCSRLGGWIKYAAEIQQAGADALELSIYYIPTDPEITGTNIENLYCEIIHTIKNYITIPIAVKISPFFSSLPNMIQKFCECGANGIVLFNKLYQPDINCQTLKIEPHIAVSTSTEIYLPLQWTAILYDTIEIDIAASTGIHTAEDAIKLIMAGANVTMMCSALYKNGLQRIRDVVTGIQRWMIKHEYHSLGQLRGIMSYKSVNDPSMFERVHYIKTMDSL